MKIADVSRLHPVHRRAPIAPLCMALLGAACGSSSSEDATHAEAPARDAGDSGSATVDAGEAGAGGGGILDLDGGADAACAADLRCGSVCCTAGETCGPDLTCVSAQAACTTGDDCWYDSYCDDGACVPYGTAPDGKDHDPSCEAVVSFDAIVPAEQCRFGHPPAGDPLPNFKRPQSTPVVVDFNFDDDPKTLAPSIVFNAAENPFVADVSNDMLGPRGTIRVIDGVDCSPQFVSANSADWTAPDGAPAVGDLDGDGRAEIVAAGYRGGVIAFAWNPTKKTFERKWRSGTCPDGSGPPQPDVSDGVRVETGVSIHDLDDDGIPEIVYYNRHESLRFGTNGDPKVDGGHVTVYRGTDGCLLSAMDPWGADYLPIIADVDEDGKMELVAADGIYEWSNSKRAWIAESYFHPNNAPAGFSVGVGKIAVADMGNFPLTSQGGQDRAEVVVSERGTVRVQTIEGTIVFGPFASDQTSGIPAIADFDGDGRAEFVVGGKQTVFDLDCVPGGDPARCSSGRTDGVLWMQGTSSGSTTVFDFNGDGAAEVVSHDTDSLSIFDGKTGDIVSSTPSPRVAHAVIADVDGDYHAEIVATFNAADGSGVLVLRDEQNRWAASRPVWNQDAYTITNVGDYGEIPKTSDVKLNWRQPGLNNFRQNVQGDLEARGVPDLTVGGQVGTVKCKGTVATIEGRVCNRGTLPMVSGTAVDFHDGSETGALLCATPIPQALQVGECAIVSCEADLRGRVTDVFVKVDPEEQARECHEKNNVAIYRGVGCDRQPR